MMHVEAAESRDLEATELIRESEASKLCVLQQPQEG